MHVFRSLSENNGMFLIQNNVFNTRYINIIILPNISFTHSSQSVRWMGSTAWNELPPDIRHLQQFQVAFKYKIKKFLVETVE